MVLVMARQEAGPSEQKTNSKTKLSQAKAKGNYSARVVVVQFFIEFSVHV